MEFQMLQFVNNVYHSICKHKLITSEKKLLAAVSGGQDSSCLLLILYLLQTQIQYVFDLIWFNHFWQKSSFFTMLHVSRCAYSFSSRILLWLPLTDIFSEQSARDWRHNATQRVYLFYQYDLCVQGHSKSDRVETVFFNLIRGTGISGIASLHRKKNQTCFSSNKFYPMFFQLTKQTHWTTIFAAVYSTCQPTNTNCINMGFAKKSQSKYLASSLSSWLRLARPRREDQTSVLRELSWPLMVYQKQPIVLYPVSTPVSGFAEGDHQTETPPSSSSLDLKVLPSVKKPLPSVLTKTCVTERFADACNKKTRRNLRARARKKSPYFYLLHKELNFHSFTAVSNHTNHIVNQSQSLLLAPPHKNFIQEVGSLTRTGNCLYYKLKRYTVARTPTIH